METITTKLIAAGILFLLTLISGLTVSNTSRPLNVSLVTIHKLIAVSTVVLLGMALYQLYKTADGRVFVGMSMMVISGILFLAMIATGVLLTREEMQLPEAILKVHQIVPLLALVFSTTTILLLIKGRS